MEAVDRRAVRGLEREVEAPRRRPVGADVQLVGTERVLVLERQLPSERGEHRAVEALARVEVGHPQVDVVEQPTGVELHGIRL